MSQGMSYEDVRTRVKRIQNTKGDAQKKANLTNSLLGQAALREGAGARRELERELRSR